MINWRKHFPAQRVALGLLGKDGYTSLLIGRYLVTHSILSPVSDFCTKVAGRPLTDDMIQSRLKRPKELTWILDNDPAAYRRGERLKKLLEADVKKAGFVPFEGTK
jgi:hypothetical protein